MNQGDPCYCEKHQKPGRYWTGNTRGWKCSDPDCVFFSSSPVSVCGLCGKPVVPVSLSIVRCVCPDCEKG